MRPMVGIQEPRDFGRLPKQIYKRKQRMERFEESPAETSFTLSRKRSSGDGDDGDNDVCALLSPFNIAPMVVFSVPG